MKGILAFSSLAPAKVLSDNLEAIYVATLREWSSSEVIAVVHARVGSVAARHQFEIDRRDLNHADLVALAARILVRSHRR